MPVEGNKEDGNVKEDENRKEPLSFLHVAEQEKVRKLISQYQKIGEAEVGVQTDKRISKEVGVQKDGNEQPKCSCHDELLDKVTSLENKLEQLVSVIKILTSNQIRSAKFQRIYLIVPTQLHVVSTALMKSRQLYCKLFRKLHLSVQTILCQA